jgi:hypothetical protein
MTVTGAALKLQVRVYGEVLEPYTHAGDLAGMTGD